MLPYNWYLENDEKHKRKGKINFIGILIISNLNEQLFVIIIFKMVKK